jgi:carotenoid cleavage dioxygenase-like enzyme
MKAYEDFWMLGITHSGAAGRKFFDRLIHGNWSQGLIDTYTAEPGRYLGGEPVFICAPGSEEAVILCQEFDASRQTSNFLFFAAGQVSRGPITRIAAGQRLYLGFHASFHPDVGSQG